MTVADFGGRLGRKPNVRAIMGIDRSRFVDLLVKAAEFYGEAR